MEFVSNKLKKMLKDLNLTLIFCEMERSGFYYPKERTIFVNEKLLENQNVNFAIAHELAHMVLQHEEFQILYNRSFVFKSKIEYEANLLAILVLLDIYLEENDIEYKQVNAMQFMQYYGIQNTLYNDIKYALQLAYI